MDWVLPFRVSPLVGSNDLISWEILPPFGLQSPSPSWRVAFWGKKKLLPELLESSELPPCLSPFFLMWMVWVVRLPRKAVFEGVFCGQVHLCSLGSYQGCGSDHSLGPARPISLLLPDDQDPFGPILPLLSPPPFYPSNAISHHILLLLIQHQAFAEPFFQVTKI